MLLLTSLLLKLCFYPIVDGVWNVWSNWTTCSLTCGNGTQSRNRTCIGPYYGGLNCSGAENDFRDCNTFHCPGNSYPLLKVYSERYLI